MRHGVDARRAPGRDHADGSLGAGLVRHLDPELVVANIDLCIHLYPVVSRPPLRVTPLQPPRGRLPLLACRVSDAFEVPCFALG